MFSSLGEFLANCPPGEKRLVDKVFDRSVSGSVFLRQCDVRIECASDQCDGVRNFEGIDFPQGSFSPNRHLQLMLNYNCRDCRRQLKTFAIAFQIPERDQIYGEILKLGENPPFGPRIPSRVISLVGPDKDNFLKGRRAENQGLGIGAFAYYRRVIEDQKCRLLDQIIRVAKRIEAPAEQIEKLNAAKSEQQFGKSVDSVKTAIPRELYIRGHNPLTLLHSALSEGIHAMTDEACLELATSVREVLFELAERIGDVLKEQKSLDAAVARLHQKK